MTKNKENQKVTVSELYRFNANKRMEDYGDRVILADYQDGPFKLFPLDVMKEMFLSDYPEQRIIELQPMTSPDQVGGKFVGNVKVYLTSEEQLADIPVATAFATSSYNEDFDGDPQNSVNSLALSKALRNLGYTAIQDKAEEVEDEVVEEEPTNKKPKVTETKAKAKTKEKEEAKKEVKEETKTEEVKAEKPKTKEVKEEKPETKKEAKTVEAEKPAKEEKAEKPKVEVKAEVKEEKKAKPKTEVVEEVKEEKVKETKESVVVKVVDDKEALEFLQKEMANVNNINFGYDKEEAEKALAEYNEMLNRTDGTRAEIESAASEFIDNFNRNNIPVGDQIFDVITSRYFNQNNTQNLPQKELYEAMSSKLNFFVLQKHVTMAKNPLEFAVAAQLFERQ